MRPPKPPMRQNPFLNIKKKQYLEDLDAKGKPLRSSYDYEFSGRNSLKNKYKVSPPDR